MKLTRRGFLGGLLSTAAGFLVASKTQPADAIPSEGLYPLLYTDHVGGHWEPWMGKTLNESDLAKRSSTTVVLGKQRVHSLAFVAIAEEPDAWARWDCVNGWTQTIEDVRAQYAALAKGRDRRGRFVSKKAPRHNPLELDRISAQAEKLYAEAAKKSFRSAKLLRAARHDQAGE